MPRTPAGSIPQLRLHRRTGLAVVTLTNPRGSRRDYYLGKFGSEESQQKYQHTVAKWIGGGRELPDVRVPVAGDLPRTVRGLTDHFLAWARGYYLRADGTPTGEVANLERACALLNEAHGDRNPEDFSPNQLRAFRDCLVDRRFGKQHDDQGGVVQGSGRTLSRGYINSVVRRIRQLFKWCESREMVPATCYHRLGTVGSLKVGRSSARESRGLSPVTEAQVKATVACLSPQIAGLVWFCWHTGARMGEAVQLATKFVDMKRDVWLFRPGQHKNLHRGKDRVVPIGKEAQAVLRPFLQVVPDRCWFRPCDVLAERNAARVAELPPARRDTRLAKNLRRRKAAPKWAPGDVYTTNAVQIAIRRASQIAGVTRWTPHMLRHAALSRIREQRGLEAAAAIGGHWTLDVTELYTSAAQQRLAIDVMRDLG